jgi:hypothetical protein
MTDDHLDLDSRGLDALWEEITRWFQRSGLVVFPAIPNEATSVVGPSEDGSVRETILLATTRPTEMS